MDKILGFGSYFLLVLLEVLRLNWEFEDEQKQTGNFAEELQKKSVWGRKQGMAGNTQLQRHLDLTKLQ